MKSNLLLEGCGSRFYSLVGQTTRLLQAGYEFDHIVGVSSGSVVAAFLASGFTPEEIHDIMMETNLGQFKDVFPFKWRSWSIFRGLSVDHWLEQQLAKKGVRTFADLKNPDASAPYRYKLRLLVADVNYRRALILPDELPLLSIDPDTFPVAKALHASMAVPGLFEPVRLSPLRGNVLLVDGSVVSSFPVWMYRYPSFPLVGLRVSPVLPYYRRINTFWGYNSALLDTILSARDRIDVAQSNIKIVEGSNCGVYPLDFSISNEKKEELYQAGIKAAERIL